MPAGSAQQGAAPAGNRPRRRLEAGSRAAWWARCGALAGWLAAEEVVAQGGGALGAAAVEADMRSRGAGAAQAGKGLGAHLVGRAVGTGGRRVRKTNQQSESNEEVGALQTAQCVPGAGA
jgi:hypothetical protein